MFRHLHAHSTFSFLDGFGTPKQIAERIKELGHDSCAITDHGNIFAHVFWQKAMRAEGIKPIFGCEFYVVDDMRSKTAATKGAASAGANSAAHVTILAKNQVGYRNLLALSRVSWVDGFYYKPRVDWNEIIKYQEGLVVLSGCPGGYPTQLLLNHGPEAMYDFVRMLSQRIENYFVEIVPEPGLSISHNSIDWLWKAACDLGIPVVITADAHFPRQEDHYVEDLMLAVGIGKKVNDPTRELRLPEYQFYCDEAQIWERTRAVSTHITEQGFHVAMQNVAWIASSCEVEIPKASKVVFPKLKEWETAEDVLWAKVAQGAQNRGVGNDPRYQQRAAHEFTTIARKGFCDYILAIADVCNWMKDQDSLVMLRGSAGGCLLLFLLGASETDPILHGLSFERFYDDNRPDPPDVDMDFEQGRRDDAIAYIFATYGERNCSQIAALSQVKAKAAVQDAASALGISRAEYAPLSAALDSADMEVDRQLREVTDEKALAVLQKYPQLRIAEKMVGQYRQSSVHACGVLVSNDPLDHVIGVVLGKDKQQVAAVDKKGAADLGFLKMDFLSVSSFDVVASAVRKIGKPMSWLSTLPLDDAGALRAANNGFLAGVFQLDGGSAARVSKEIGLHSFADVVAASALCRPGPGDWVAVYQKNKLSPESFAAYLGAMHPVAAEVVRETYGILLYQEQVMRLARELAQFDWPTVHKLRKGVQDKLGLDPQTGPAWRAEWSTRFIEGCKTTGVSQTEAEFWWKSIESHGAYSFNKSHCVTYGLVGYWMLYLKAHHPAEFYEAYLSLESDPIKIKRLIGEFRALGGQVEFLSPTTSKYSFSSPRAGVLVGGYINITGVGPKSAETILSRGPFIDWDGMFSAMGKAQAEKIKATGVCSACTTCYGTGCEDCNSTGKHWNVQQLLLMAPWFPVPAYGRDELQLKLSNGLAGVGDIPRGTAVDGDVLVAGYVTATDFGHKVLFTVEDPTGSILCRVSARNVPVIGAKFRELKVGDFVAVTGWWPGDCLFVKDYVMLKAAERITAKANAKSTRSK